MHSTSFIEESHQELILLFEEHDPTLSLSHPRSWMDSPSTDALAGQKKVARRRSKK
jgi:hypothetical protein